MDDIFKRLLNGVVARSLVGIILSLMLVASMPGGCSNEEKPTAPNLRGSRPEHAAEPDPEPMPVTPAVAVGMDLDIGGRIQAADCVIVQIGISPARPGLLHVSSNGDVTSDETASTKIFPEISLRVPLTGGDLTALVGKALPAQLHVQLEADGKIWFQNPEQNVDLTIESVDGDVIKGTLKGTVRSTESNVITNVNGSFVGKLAKS